MRVSVSQAKGQLLELVRRAEAGEEIELTRRGETVVKLVRASRRRLSAEERRTILLKAMEEGAAKALPGDAARSADFLYDDETGLPA